MKKAVVVIAAVVAAFKNLENDDPKIKKKDNYSDDPNSPHDAALKRASARRGFAAKEVHVVQKMNVIEMRPKTASWHHQLVVVVR